MKILISILLVSSLAFLSENEPASNVLADCSCSSLTCSCQATGCEYGGAGSPSCDCGLFSCNCSCDAQAQPHQLLPTANDTQNENSEGSQGYFNNLGTEAGTTIAGYIKTLRTAIANKDLDTYKENAPLVEAAFKNLTESEQMAYATWAVDNLTPIKD